MSTPPTDNPPPGDVANPPERPDAAYSPSRLVPLTIPSSTLARETSLPELTPSEASVPQAHYDPRYHSQPPLIPANHFETALDLLRRVGPDPISTQDAQTVLAASSYHPTPESALTAPAGPSELIVPVFPPPTDTAGLLAVLNATPYEASLADKSATPPPAPQPDRCERLDRLDRSYPTRVPRK